MTTDFNVLAACDPGIGSCVFSDMLSLHVDMGDETVLLMAYTLLAATGTAIVKL